MNVANVSDSFFVTLFWGVGTYYDPVGVAGIETLGIVRSIEQDSLEIYTQFCSGYVYLNAQSNSVRIYWSFWNEEYDHLF